VVNQLNIKANMKLNWGEQLAVNNPLRPIMQRLEIQWFRRKLPLAAGGKILEVGCGRGMGARLIHKVFHPLQLSIQDLDIKMIRKAKYRYAPSEEQGVTVSVGDAAYLSFKTDMFDAVFGFGVLHHVPDWREALGEIGRVLKPGGIYFVEEIFPSLYQNWITKHLLLHPKEDRFRSKDFRQAFERMNMPFFASFELPGFGILAVAVKQ
jgi:ubiquinone/menaquinone biosynthesis C-methylase UbiE